MAATFSEGSIISHYQIISRLGAGGMGEVWLAEDARLKRKVAIKLLPSEFTSSGDRLRRFEQEAQAASALNHPNIVSIYDIGEDEAGKFIVMEYVSGQNLRSLISKRLTAGQLSDLALQVSKGLNAAHTAGITHRDIKPENIMIRDDGFIKLVDFGLARLLPKGFRGRILYPGPADPAGYCHGDYRLHVARTGAGCGTWPAVRHFCAGSSLIRTRRGNSSVQIRELFGTPAGTGFTFTQTA